jgi:protein O-mannosyl-transferase
VQRLDSLKDGTSKESVRTDALRAAALLLLTIAAYLPALSAGFIWDDDLIVADNPTLRSLGGLRDIWLGILNGGHAYPLTQYYPLTFTSFWLEQHAWGVRTAVPYHLTNILLHATAAVVLWRLLRRLAVPGAWLAAGLFALHPVHVESVAWVSERKNTLSCMLSLLSLLAYLRFAGIGGTARRRWLAWAGAALLFVAALGAKTVAASLPAAALLVVWWKRGRVRAADVAPLVPFFVLGAGAGALTGWMERHRVGAWGPDWDLSLLERGLIAGRALSFYVGKLLWPHPLAFVYPRWRVDPHAWWQYLFPLAALATVAILWSVRRRIGRGPVTAVLFFAGTLVPALGFVDVWPMRYSFVADHFQYVASIGPLVLAASLLARIRPERAGAALVAVLFAALGTLTWRQCRAYADVETLWRDTLAKNPSAWMAHHNYGNLLRQQARTEAVEARREANRDAAAAEFRAALALKPDYADAALALGHLAEERGDRAAAIVLYREAIRIAPPQPPGSPGEQHSAVYHFSLARALAADGGVDEAIDRSRTAVQLAPGYEAARMQLGVLLGNRGEMEEAITQFRAVLSVDPDAADAHTNLALALARQGDVDAALAHLAEARRLQPDNARIPYLMGIVADVSSRRRGQ